MDKDALKAERAAATSAPSSGNFDEIPRSPRLARSWGARLRAERN
jgi:hypothetical protein